MGERENKVKDLVEEIKNGEITPDEARIELNNRGLGHKEELKDFIGYIVWGALYILPLIARRTGLEILSFFAQLPAIEIPTIVVYLSIILFIAMIPLTAWGMNFNSKRGGCRSEDNTVILLKSGPYAIVRHPSGVAWAIFFATAPIILSGVVPFTILSVVAIVEIIAFHYYMCVIEERELNIPKWGEEYLQYMKEVPRFNLVKGLLNFRNR